MISQMLIVILLYHNHKPIDRIDWEDYCHLWSNLAGANHFTKYIGYSFCTQKYIRIQS
jgi:hypothetical protein